MKQRCDDLGLSIDLYQPFRDFDSVHPAAVEHNLRRADRKFDVMEQLGTDLVLVCSANYPDAVDDEEQIAEQLHRLAVRARRTWHPDLLRGAGLVDLRQPVRTVLG